MSAPIQCEAMEILALAAFLTPFIVLMCVVYKASAGASSQPTNEADTPLSSRGVQFTPEELADLDRRAADLARLYGAMDALATFLANMTGLPDDQSVCVTTDGVERENADDPSPLTLEHLRTIAGAMR